MLRRSLALVVPVVLLAGCGGGGHGPEVSTHAGAPIPVPSPGVAEGEQIPTRFTCDGRQVSPPLQWSGGSPKAWALVVDDPDAPGGTFVHWVVLDIGAGTTSVGTGAVPTGGTQVVNS